MTSEEKQIICEKYFSSPRGWGAWLKSKKNKRLLDQVNKEYLFTDSVAEKVYLLANNLLEPPKCKTCGKYAVFDRRKYTQYCSVKCAQNSDETRLKYKQTCLQKYGAENAAQSTYVQDKMKKTCLEKYGVENAFASEEIKQKIKESNIKKFGVENPQQNANIKAKSRQTLLQKYGITCGFHNHQDYTRSKGEIELFDFISNIFKDAEYSNRAVINPFELDIYIPSVNIGLEYDGDYWHSLPNMIERDLVKNEICQRKGIRLIRVKENDWYHDVDIKNKILKEIHSL